MGGKTSAFGLKAIIHRCDLLSTSHLSRYIKKNIQMVLHFLMQFSYTFI